MHHADIAYPIAPPRRSNADVPRGVGCGDGRPIKGIPYSFGALRKTFGPGIVERSRCNSGY
ncbi:hypothetical protein RSO01_88840 [Reyranella soli]|uniref:Uncharacterized protein n=1 Tax=Reyranella soli TaxID=1230389 RepID=A0A512NRX5_9HYPH|nr:hypothetical protein RSO01_88840 [Reyranella soli]